MAGKKITPEGSGLGEGDLDQLSDEARLRFERQRKIRDLRLSIGALRDAIGISEGSGKDSGPERIELAKDVAELDRLVKEERAEGKKSLH